jgi:hypothetical protein
MGQVQLDESLRRQQDQTLKRDVQEVLACYDRINSQTNHNYDHTRVLGVVAASSGADKYLPRTIPKIIDQIDELGLKTDIVLGLNNGYACETVIHEFTTLPNVQVVHLYTEAKAANNQPARIFTQSDCQGTPYHLQNDHNNHPNQLPHRIFVLHQKASPHAAGKIRVLGDIYGSLFLSSIARGWQPPALLMTFDAETELMAAPRGQEPIPNANGLGVMLKQLRNEPDLDILGATIRYTIYQPAATSTPNVCLPRLEQEVSSIHWFVNIVHGLYPGYQLNPGGGTIGKTGVMLSLLSVIASNYPGVRAEDIQMTLIAHHAQFKQAVCLDAVHTNRTPSRADLAIAVPPQFAWQEQMIRWLSSIQALKENYGDHNIAGISSSDFPWWIVLNPTKFIKSWLGKEKITLFTLFKALRNIIAAAYAIQVLRKFAARNPDILQGAEAQASWEMAAHVTPELVLEPGLNRNT